MRIVDLQRNKECNKNGLGDINLNTLKEIVILAGPNGSGKTRMLKMVKEMGEGYSNYISDINSIKYDLEKAKRDAPNMASGAFRVEINESQYTNKIANIEKEIKDKFNIKLTEPNSTKINIVDFGKDLIMEMMSPTTLKYSEIQEIYDRIPKMPVGEIYKNIDVILTYLFTDLHVKVHSDKYSGKYDISEIDKIIDDITRLIFNNLSCTLTINDTGIMFNGNSINTFSDGQLIILKLSVASYFKENLLKNNIIIFDEPENYLHSKAVIEILDFIHHYVGQIWIATHNLSIISHFFSQSIVYLENGKIRQNGNIQLNVIDSLLGTSVEDLRAFIDSSYTIGFTKFCYDCLFLPQPIANTSNDDIQMLQFNETILKFVKKSNDDKLKILDFGAGKGRLLSFLHATNSPDSILNKLDYIAFDKGNSTDKEDILKILSTVYNDKITRYFDNINNIIDLKIQFDIIVMANVLHEIPVIEWIKLLSDSIYRLLTDDGRVLILENSEMLNGENANEFGFLAVNSASLKILFDCGDLYPLQINNSMIDKQKEKYSRIQAHLIERNMLLAVNLKTVTGMLEFVAKHSLDEVKKIKEYENKNIIQGKRLGFYYQQYASSSMALAELRKRSFEEKI